MMKIILSININTTNPRSIESAIKRIRVNNNWRHLTVHLILAILFF